jgi:surface protein
MSFPSSPTVGQQATVGGRQFVWQGAAWDLADSGGGLVIVPWIRPDSWLPLPSVTGQQRFVGLHRIDPQSTFVALSAAGAYTVDWGDGTTTNHTTGSTAYKTYSYGDIPTNGEPTLGYRQVVIQVYPQAGQNLTTLNLQRRHNLSGLSSYSPMWLEVAVNGSSLTSLTLGGSVPLGFLEQATVGTTAVTNMTNLFRGCRALRSVALLSTGAVTLMDTMFSDCTAMQAVSLFDTSAVTSMASMFSGCTSLRSPPVFDTQNVTVMNSMFSGCTSLQSVPAFNTIKVFAANSMFQNCLSLQATPTLITAALLSCGNMFFSCPSLRSAAFSAAGVLISSASMFGLCPSLSAVVLPGIVVDISFANCQLSASTINAIYTALGTVETATITVSGNWGAETADATIATAKGWTVIG